MGKWKITRNGEDITEKVGASLRADRPHMTAKEIARDIFERNGLDPSQIDGSDNWPCAWVGTGPFRTVIPLNVETLEDDIEYGEWVTDQLREAMLAELEVHRGTKIAKPH